MVGGKVLILGGIRSGKSGFAESLLDEASQVRYVATATAGEDDAAFAERIQAHRFRRPASWETIEATSDPAQLAEAIANADMPVLVDDLGGWAASLLGRKDSRDLISQLTDALHACPAQVILVSPEVGLSVVPPTSEGVEFADLLGQLNQAVARACDSVALIVAGQPTWLKKGRPRYRPVVKPPVAAEIGDTREDVFSEPTRALPIVVTGLKVAPGMDLPIHDDDARSGAEQHLSNLDIRGGGLGELAKTVTFAAGTQSNFNPQAWKQPHMLLLHGAHEGDIAAGNSAGYAARIADEAQRGEGAIGLLAGWNGVTLKVIEAETAEDIAYGRAVSPELVDEMLTEGWRLADEAVDSGSDLIIIGSCSPGGDGAAATVVARLTGGEIATLLARIVGPDGSIDDSSWMLRCAAARDALHRVRNLDLMAKTLLSELAGADMALAVGVILGATARRTAVLMDGPVATAAALLARDLGSQSRLWCTLPDHSGHPTTKAAADVLGLAPIMDLKTDLGEGAVSLLALPLLRAGLHLSTSLGTKPLPETGSAPETAPFTDGTDLVDGTAPYPEPRHAAPAFPEPSHAPVPPGEAPQVESSHSEPPSSATSQREPLWGGSSLDETSYGEPLRDDAAQPEPSYGQGQHSDAPHAEAALPSERSDSSYSESSYSEALRGETPPSETAYGEAPRGEATQPEHPQGQAPQGEAPHTEAASPDEPLRREPPPGEPHGQPLRGDSSPG